MNSKKIISCLALTAYIFFFVSLGNKSFSETQENPAPESTKSIIQKAARPSGHLEKSESKELFDLIEKKSEPVIEEAQKLIKDKNFESAVKILSRFVSKLPLDARPYYMLAILYSNLGEEEKVYNILEKATEYKIDFNFIFEKFQEAVPVKQNTDDIVPAEKISIATFKDNKQCAISFSFDDGPKAVYTHALPLFDQYGYKATLNLNPERTTKHTDESLGTWEEWQDAHKRGFEIGNHTMNHTLLLGQPDDVLEYEVNEAYKIITQKMGEPPLNFIFPRGRGFFDEKGVKKARERHIAIIDQELLLPVYKKVFLPNLGSDYLSLETAENLTSWGIQNRLWIVPQCHSLKVGPWSSFRPITVEFLRDYLAFIKHKEDVLWIDTFSNIYRYLFEKNQTKIITEKSTPQHLTFRLENKLDSKIYSVPLTVIINPASGKLQKASAKQNNKPLNVEIRDTVLLVNVVPTTSSVYVEWK